MENIICLECSRELIHTSIRHLFMAANDLYSIARATELAQHNKCPLLHFTTLFYDYFLLFLAHSGYFCRWLILESNKF